MKKNKWVKPTIENLTIQNVHGTTKGYVGTEQSPSAPGHATQLGHWNGGPVGVSGTSPAINDSYTENAPNRIDSGPS